jgi:hypothetical protein
VLKAKVYALLSVDGKEAPRIYDAGSIEVGVTVSPAGWAERHWTWLAGRIVLPLITYWFKRLTGKPKDTASG